MTAAHPAGITIAAEPPAAKGLCAPPAGPAYSLQMPPPAAFLRGRLAKKVHAPFGRGMGVGGCAGKTFFASDSLDYLSPWIGLQNLRCPLAALWLQEPCPVCRVEVRASTSDGEGFSCIWPAAKSTGTCGAYIAYAIYKGIAWVGSPNTGAHKIHRKNGCGCLVWHALVMYGTFPFRPAGFGGVRTKGKGPARKLASRDRALSFLFAVCGQQRQGRRKAGGMAPGPWQGPGQAWALPARISL